jgi:hypothetical protein
MQIADATCGLALATVCIAVGCGSSAGSTNNDAGAGASGGPICASHTVELVGMLDGAPANGAYSGPASYSFANALSGTIPGSFDVQFGTAGALHLQWTTLAADDQTVPASGMLTMPSEGPHAGQTYCLGAGSITPRSQAQGSGMSFAFSTVASGACPGTPVAGSLQGCAAASM